MNNTLQNVDPDGRIIVDKHGKGGHKVTITWNQDGSLKFNKYATPRI